MNGVFTTFHQFPRLPPEIRIKIWEETWPEPRVIEVREFWPSLTAGEPEAQEESDALEGANNPEERRNTGNPDDSDSESLGTSIPGDYIGLQLAGSLSSFMDINIGSRNTWDRPFEDCPGPSSLQICHESRAHTLRHFACMIDSKVDSHSFYFNPRCDVLWLCTDITDEGAEKVAELRQHYGRQLGLIQNVLVEELNWEERGGPTSYCSNFLNIYEGIRLVQILLEGYEFGDQTPLEPAKYPDQAKELKERDAAILGNRQFDWTIEYIDRGGRVYCQLKLDA